MEREDGFAEGAEFDLGQVLAEEAHWQEVWRNEETFASPDSGDERVLVVAGGGSHGDSLTLSEARQYIVADFHARFHRVRGAAVLFSLGLGPSTSQKDSAEASGPTSQREQLEALGLSVDWARSFARRDPDAQRWAQQAFLALLKAGLVARSDAPTRWCERCRTALPGEAGPGEQCPVCSGPLRQLAAGAWFLRLDAGPDAMPASMTRALKAMAPTDLLGRTEGWELDVVTTNGMPIALFAEDPDKLEQAAFVGISPHHPALEQLIDDPGLKQRIQGLLQGKPGSGGTISDTGFWVQAPPLPDPLPLVVTLTADARFGVTAYLGVPSANAQDAATAKNLPPPPSMRWSVKAKPPKPRPAERFRLNRLPLSAGEADGPSLSVSLADGEEVRLDPLAATWMETLVAIPPEDRATADPSHAEAQRWVAEMHTFREAASGSALLGDLALIEALAAGQEDQGGENGDAPALDLVVGPIREGAAGSVEEPDLRQLAQRFGIDALRFAILHGSAPTKQLDRAELEASLAPAARFLAQLRSYAEPRLNQADDAVADAADADDPLRNRLRKWCRTALWKVTENEQRLDTHRATRNLRILLTRIEDFEQQAIQERGELTAQDRQLIHEALCLLIGLLAPIAPHLAEGLWKQAGNDGLASRAPWPRALDAVPG
jgi:leucyl-tRNA synthetase